MSEPNDPDLSDESARHNRKMKKIKAARDRMMAGKTTGKGLIIVHTGAGKGKSSAAFGMAIRMIGHGGRVGVVQFIKGAWETGEARLLARFPDQVVLRAMGAGFTWETQNRDQDIALAGKAWEAAREMLADPGYGMVILDELNVCLRYGFVDTDAVLAALRDRSPGQRAVVTGRNAPDALIRQADLVTEMKLIKHPFREQGIKAQPGVEY